MCTKENMKKDNHLIKKLAQKREVSLVILIVIICALLTISNENFLRMTNMRIIIQGFATDMIIGVALCISLIAGNIDFSVGSILGFAGMVCAMLLNNGNPIALAIIAALAAGVVLGLINGLIVTRFKLLPIVATIGTWMAYGALTLVLSNGTTAASLPIEFKAIGQGSTLGIPNNVIFMAIVLAIGIILLRKVKFFHQAYFIGGNKKSAELVGINVKRFTTIMYMFTGFAAAMAGVLLVSRLGNSGPTTGKGTEFRLVVALLIGGVSFDGGEGTIIGAALGIALMGFVQNALVMLSVNVYWNDFVTGAILILAVAVDALSKARRRTA